MGAKRQYSERSCPLSRIIRYEHRINEVYRARAVPLFLEPRQPSPHGETGRILTHMVERLSG